MVLLEVGRIGRPHGLLGEVVVHLVTNRTERLAVGTRLWARRPDAEPGSGVELEITSTRPHQNNHLVCFAGTSDRDAAGELRGAVLEAEALEDPDALFVHDLIGAEVVDQLGVARGAITSVEANPASDLLVVDNRHYVPLRFVVEHRPGLVVVDVPDGIFE